IDLSHVGGVKLRRLFIDRRHDEQVHRCDGTGAIAKEGPPALRGWPPRLRHVFCYGGLPDIDTELEQFAVDPRRTPQRVRDAHLANELANFGRCSWSAAARS